MYLDPQQTDVNKLNIIKYTYYYISQLTVPVFKALCPYEWNSSMSSGACQSPVLTARLHHSMEQLLPEISPMPSDFLGMLVVFCKGYCHRPPQNDGQTILGLFSLSRQ